MALKVLDAEGVKYLWDQINIQDYPNNETLIAVIDAIDSTKLDKDTFEEYIGSFTRSIEPKVDDIPLVFIDGIIPTTKDAVEAEMTYISKTLTFHAYIEIKCQGNSSMSYPKKNFTIKLFKDADRSQKMKLDFKGWGK